MKIMASLAVVSVAALAGCASVQERAVERIVRAEAAPVVVAKADEPVPPKPVSRLRSAVIADLEAAITIAQAAGDKYGVQCHTAGLEWFKGLPSCEIAAPTMRDLPPAAGVVSEAERVRVLRMRAEASAGVVQACVATVRAIIAGGPPPSLIEACAVVYHDARSTARKLIEAMALLP